MWPKKRDPSEDEVDAVIREQLHNAAQPEHNILYLAHEVRPLRGSNSRHLRIKHVSVSADASTDASTYMSTPASVAHKTLSMPFLRHIQWDNLLKVDEGDDIWTPSCNHTFYIYGLPDDEARTRRLRQFVDELKKGLGSLGQTLSFTRIDGSTFSIAFGMMCLTIVLSSPTTIADVLYNKCALGASVGYDGHRYYFTPVARYLYECRALILYKFRPQTAAHVMRHFKKGREIVFPHAPTVSLVLKEKGWDSMDLHFDALDIKVYAGVCVGTCADTSQPFRALMELANSEPSERRLFMDKEMTEINCRALVAGDASTIRHFKSNSFEDVVSKCTAEMAQMDPKSIAQVEYDRRKRINGLLLRSIEDSRDYEIEEFVKNAAHLRLEQEFQAKRELMRDFESAPMKWAEKKSASTDIDPAHWYDSREYYRPLELQPSTVPDTPSTNDAPCVDDAEGESSGADNAAEAKFSHESAQKAVETLSQILDLLSRLLHATSAEHHA